MNQCPKSCQGQLGWDEVCHVLMAVGPERLVLVEALLDSGSWSVPSCFTLPSDKVFKWSWCTFSGAFLRIAASLP